MKYYRKLYGKYQGRDGKTHVCVLVYPDDVVLTPGKWYTLIQAKRMKR